MKHSQILNKAATALFTSTLLSTALFTAPFTASAAETPDPEMIAEQITFDIIAVNKENLGSTLYTNNSLKNWQKYSNGEINPRDLKISFVRANGEEVELPGETNGIAGCKYYRPDDSNELSRCLGKLPKGEKITIKLDPQSLPEGWHMTVKGCDNAPTFVENYFEHIVGEDTNKNCGVNSLRISLAKHNIEFWPLGGTIDGSTANISRIIKRDKTVDFPQDPTKAGLKFLGWYTYNSGREANQYITPKYFTVGKKYVNPSWAISGKSTAGYDKDQFIWTADQFYDARGHGHTDWNDKSFDPIYGRDPQQRTILRAQWGVALTYDFNGGTAAGANTKTEIEPLTYAPEKDNLTYPQFADPAFTLLSATELQLNHADHIFQGWKVLDSQGQPTGDLLPAGTVLKPTSNTTIQAQWALDDADHDGIAQSKDQCKGTPAGAEVDPHGCAVAPSFPKDIPAVTGQQDQPINAVNIPITNPGKASNFICTATGLPTGLEIGLSADGKNCVISGTPTQATDGKQKVAITLTYTPADRGDSARITGETSVTITAAPQPEPTPKPAPTPDPVPTPQPVPDTPKLADEPLTQPGDLAAQKVNDKPQSAQPPALTLARTGSASVLGSVIALSLLAAGIFLISKKRRA